MATERNRVKHSDTGRISRRIEPRHRESCANLRRCWGCAWRASTGAAGGVDAGQPVPGV